MAIFKTASVVVLTGTLTLSGCVNPDGTTNNTGTGASVGAVLGGLLGRAVSGDKGKGTIIGGLIGGAIGGAIGADLDAQEAALRESMGGSVSIFNTGTQLIVSLPEEITFATNSAVVKSSLVADLNTLAASMNAYPNTMIEVVGHTDNTGTSAYNQALSEQRARAVRGILINIVNPNRVLAYGVGETRPVASNSSSAGRQANRRVEIYITPK
ncbi:MAG: OmpA family protein [Paracoccaceae bacterium]|jgi:outer membrane protein OmpA-like peptidoglycan-associated protein